MASSTMGQTGHNLHGSQYPEFDFPFPGRGRRGFARDSPTPHEKIVMFVGRGVREKGLSGLLIDALPSSVSTILEQSSSSAAEEPNDLIRSGEPPWGSQKVFLTGFIHDDDLLRLSKVSDGGLLPQPLRAVRNRSLGRMAARTPGGSLGGRRPERGRRA